MLAVVVELVTLKWRWGVFHYIHDQQWIDSGTIYYGIFAVQSKHKNTNNTNSGHLIRVSAIYMTKFSAQRNNASLCDFTIQMTR